jgi:hypothetical protein
MFAATITITHNAVAKVLQKDKNLSSGVEYYLNDGNTRFRLLINHIIPKTGAAGESHMARLNVEYYNATTGAFEREVSSWCVIKTLLGVQNDAESEYCANALAGFLTAANVTKLVDREIG